MQKQSFLKKYLSFVLIFILLFQFCISFNFVSAETLNENNEDIVQETILETQLSETSQDTNSNQNDLKQKDLPIVKSPPKNGNETKGFNPGESVLLITNPDPANYSVVVGTAFNEIGLQPTIQVTYLLANGTDEEIRDELVIWDSADPENPYNSEADGDYLLYATFEDSNLANYVAQNNIELNVTVTVKCKELADKITNLPTPSETANLSAADKLTLRVELIHIKNELELLTDEEKLDLEDYVGNLAMTNFDVLYDLYVINNTDIAEFLDGDWAYISNFSVTEIYDGTGPFDTSDDPNDISYKNRQGNDENDSNRIVRTFDIVSYDLSYTTAISGEYLWIKEGYLCYEFKIPYEANQAQWEISSMTWTGLKVNNKSDLDDKHDGESYYHLETKVINGQTYQVLTGKRFITPTPPNPSAFPGDGTLNAIVRVLNLDNGTTIQPEFKAWLEHNETEGVCPRHNRTEPKTAIGDPVTVTSELRLNVQMLPVSTSYAVSRDHFDFSTGNDLAMNKDAGTVYGRLTGYGITLQLYNPDPNYKGVVMKVEDRKNLEGLVMAEFGENYEGMVLVAQAIRDTMLKTGIRNTITVKQKYGYTPPIRKNVSNDCKRAVAYVFDEGNSAVQHPIHVFYATKYVKSKWHETQKFVFEWRHVRFFAMWHWLK